MHRFDLTPEDVGVPSHDENVAEIHRIIDEYLLDNQDVLTPEKLLGDIDPEDPKYIESPLLLRDALQDNVMNVYTELRDSHGDNPYEMYANTHGIDVEEVFRRMHQASSIECFITHWAEITADKTQDAGLGAIRADHPIQQTYLDHKRAVEMLEALGPIGGMLGMAMGGDITQLLGGLSPEAEDVDVKSSGELPDGLEDLFNLDFDLGDFPDDEL